MTLHLTFLGGVGTVTGSKYLLEAGGQRILVDCGLFQGFKKLRLRNWAPLPFDPASLDAVILTHAHLDHSGYVSLLVRNGFNGSIYATSGTPNLCSVLLPDSGHLQEYDTSGCTRKGPATKNFDLPQYGSVSETVVRNLLSWVEPHRQRSVIK